MIPASLQTTMTALMLSLAAGVPLLMAVFCCTPLKKRVIRLLPWATVPALLIALTVPGDAVVEVGWFFMGGRMGLDATGRIFLSLSAFVWLLASFSSRNLLQGSNADGRFYRFFLTAMAGNFGLILAQGMLGYYLFFAMMSFSAYGLVVFKGNEDALNAGRLYIFLLMIGEVALFTVLIILAHTCGGLALEDIAGISYQPLTIVLLFIGFGVKVGTLPLHGWMIPAYQTTPIPAAAAFAGSMVNAGILGWLRFLPLGETSCPQGAVLFIVVGALAAVYGVIVGLKRKQAGAVLGASSISQMGLITVIFGLGLLNQDAGLHAAPVLILYVVHHSLAKSSLFFGYDLVERQGRRLSYLQLAAILLPALSLAGLPFTSGAIAKTAFKEFAASLGEPWSGLSTFFLPVTAMGTTMLMLHFILVIRHSRRSDKPGRTASQIVFALSCIAAAATLWLWPAADNFASHSVAGNKLLQGLWTFAGGCLLFLAWRKISFTAEVPADDRKRKSDFNSIVNTVTHLLQEKEYQQPLENRLVIFLRRLVPQLRRTEKIMGRWKVVGLSYIALCLCLLFLLL
ncbi:MAG: proton-conducting transporter membrane subunit [Thermodesulfobacteriota bacterium]|nr:proton-conducting transporter membrane subunit [Thermodesulfobacteriota bacterium]